MKFAIALVSVIGLAQADFKSGSVASYDKYTYGKFITKMKNPNKDGTVASFYTYWDGPGFYPGGWNEIDMNIVPSVAEQPLSTNVIYGDGHNKIEDHTYSDWGVNDNEWHTYAMEWTPSYIEFQVDGKRVRRLEDEDHAAVNFMHKAQSLRMNFWTPTFHAWGAELNSEDMPWYLLFDYVEAYKYNKDSGDFELDWRDDFNEFDQTRWHKLSGTFEANSSIFYPQNVYTSEGNLVIKMEPEFNHHDFHHHIDHEHYHSDHGLGHIEQEHLTHEALPEGPTSGSDQTAQKKEKAQVGKLEPKGEEITKKKQAKEQEKQRRHQQTQSDHRSTESKHLEPRELDGHHDQPTVQHTGEKPSREIMYHSRHELYRELSHKYDDQHDIEPVHYHEHAIHVPFAADVTDQHDLNLDQTTSQQSKDQKQVEHKPILQVPHSIITPTQEETPYEHQDRYYHDSDAHFWSTEHQHHGGLYDSLQDHYKHEVHPFSHDVHGHWTAAQFDFPVKERPLHHEERVPGGQRPHETVHEIPLYPARDIEIVPLYHKQQKEHEPAAIHYGDDHPDHRYYAHEPLIEKKGEVKEKPHVAAPKQHEQAKAPAVAREKQDLKKTLQDAGIVTDEVKAVKDLVQKVQEHDVQAHHAPQAHQQQPYYDQHYARGEHSDIAMHTVHEDHKALSHSYDDQKDVEPVHFQEHAVHHAFDHPDSRSYQHDPQALDFDREYDQLKAFDHRYREQEHEHEHLERPLLHDFLIQEPEHEQHHPTFHGREQGYKYREHAPAEQLQDHFSKQTTGTDFHHGETFGQGHKKEDKREYKSKLSGARMHRDVYIEPLFDEEPETHHALEEHAWQHHEPLEGHHQPIRRGTEMQYEIDDTGHVYLRDQYQQMHHYLQ